MKKNTSIIYQTFKQSKRTAYKLTKGFAELRKAKSVDYRFGKGKTREIPLVTFKITPLCNLRCLMCGQNGEKGTLIGRVSEEAEKIVPIERYKSLTDELAGITKVFYIWGGEPFLYPGFMDLASYMAKKVLFTVNTNGTFLAENAERIVKDRWTGIFISLDSFEDVNDKIRGKGTYARVMEGIEALKREKEKQNSLFPHVGIVSTISNLNYMYLDKLAEAMHDKGLSWHIINLGTYMTDAIGKEQEEFYRDKFQTEARYWKGFASGYNEGIDGQAFERILQRVHDIDNGYPIITVPAIKPEKIGLYYSDPAVPVFRRCAVPWFSANIDYNGDVHFCADYPDYVIGNIMEGKLLDIYNNDRAVKFRRTLKDSPDGLFPACRRCYQLMLCGKRIRGF